MSHKWLIITFSWIGTVSLQYINTGGPADTVDPMEATFHSPLPYVHYFNQLPPHPDIDIEQADAQAYNSFFQHEEPEQPLDLQRKRRTVEPEETIQSRNWLPNLIDTDKTTYLRNDGQLPGNPFILGFTSTIDENGTNRVNLLEPMDKKNFSPWGGKRGKASVEHMWTWKRSSGIREPNMPKRVRFSPWGGKRSGQMVYKPGNKGSKIIFSTTVPELTRVVSNFSPSGERFNLAGFQFIPTLDKRHPIKLLALSAQVDDKSFRVALPFKAFLETLPKMFKPGHPYIDVNLKKDGKRKVKFSAWGGKRSPPIIGPIWSPAPQNIKESTLKTLLLMRNEQENDDSSKAN